ncbi:sulfite reductase, ferredoxin dependent [Brasilonema octagenarum UFV-E1]|uniref:Sulfite reductase [ferredoxin] n=1 Tax=Brasilonema sennae CENA114 TaxID=415709 RepID=A0A856MMJ4_9CYAN|nr:sulfite reductase, ferredoxin dependent [Brasilonema sennae]QDL11324.1 sulfite reductase, ferredoxin dependent [Brasilonema sennae CENA114]QDL17665.1 sulfite reductase, ferredoxin dependent [Brasilonema octagenarum UFV-E1]
MVKSAPPTTSRKPSKVEAIKERSNSLREPVATEILQDTTHFSEDAIQILKFHGSYQQDNRDNRVKGQEKDYQFMLRTRNPGGFVPPQLFLTLDKLADEYGSNTLRVTTRQGFQMHGILKKNLKAAFAAIIKNMGSTLGACGDVNRNVMAPPAPFKNKPEYQYAWEYADNIASLLTPQTGAYYEIWLDGEMAISAEENPEVKAAREKNGTGTIFHDKEEPLYGTYYMPRKFKACVTVPGDNSIDLYSQDLTLVVITNDKEELEGFDVFAGGGLGRTHNKEETFARIADPICYVDKNDVYDLVKAIVATQRDYGDRTDRRHARLKYLIHDWGVDKFRSQVEEYFGKSLAPFKKLPEFKYHDFLGWNEQGDGKLFLGISIDNGRIKDEGDFQLKTALREIVEKYNLPIRLTPHQNLVLYDIEPKNKQAIQKILSSHGVIFEPEKIDSLVRYAMACPALPTCGLAITESERAIPGILERIRALLDKTGLPNEHFVVRMTGCPNGCARPYMAELGFVGSAPESYQVWLGGSPNQTRLALPYMERLHDNDIETQLEPIFVYFKQQRQTEETFGDFCDRMGFDAIREFAANYESQTVASPEITDDGDGLVEAMADSTTAPITEESDRQEVAIANTTTATSKNRHRVTLQDEVYDRLKEISQRQGKAMTNLVNEALLDYLKNL